MAGPQPPESKDIQKEIIKQSYKDWLAFLKEKGERPQGNMPLEAEVAFDARNDEASLVNSDVISVDGAEALDEPPFKPYPADFKARKNEKWIDIRISPKDRYRTQVFHYKGWYFVPELNLHISNQGRAYEQTLLHEVSLPGTLDGRLDVIATLKESPVEPIELDFDPQDLDDPRAYVEPFQPLHQQNLERMMFLQRQAKLGNFIQYNSQTNG